jgi:hypothetical protein
MAGRGGDSSDAGSLCYLLVIEKDFSKMELTPEDKAAVGKILQLSQETGINIKNGRIRGTSSRFCLGVEHGDYNGTELFGVGTDRFIWLAYRPNGTDGMKLFSGNFPDDGVIAFKLGDVPEPKSASIAETWGRFAYGVEYILRREGLKLTQNSSHSPGPPPYRPMSHPDQILSPSPPIHNRLF